MCIEYKERRGDRDIVLRVLTNVVLLKDRTSLVTALVILFIWYFLLNKFLKTMLGFCRVENELWFNI